MSERGEIRHRDRRRQLVDFRGMAYGTITPTDLDLLIDYHNDRFVFAELKFRGAKLEYGQKTALVRLVDLAAAAGKRGVLFLADHEVDDTRQDIEADRCIVRAVYERGEWRQSETIQTLREAVDLFLGYQPVSQVSTSKGERPTQVGLPTMDDPTYAAHVYEFLKRPRV